MRRGLLLGFLCALLPVASHAAITVTEATPTLVPGGIPRNAPETTILAINVIGNPAGDTLTSCTLTLSGGNTPASHVDTISLFVDANKNARFDPSDTFLAQLLPGPPGKYVASALSRFLPGGADSFVFAFAFEDTAHPNDDFQSQISANDVVCSVDGPGPGGPLTLAGLWKVALPDTSGPNTWYVNDTSLVGDLFTTDTGQTSNSGLFPETPKRFLNDIEALLTPGDTVFVDAGTYNEPDTFTIAGNGISLIGKDSTATVIDFNDQTAASDRAILAKNLTSLVIRDLHVTRGRFGIRLENADTSVVERVRSTSNGLHGFSLDAGSDGNRIEGSLSTNNSSIGIQLLSSNGNKLIKNRIADNTATGVHLDGSSDNILRENASVRNSYGFNMQTSANRNRFVHNLSSNNTLPGFRVVSSNENLFVQNTADSIADWAFSVEGTAEANTFTKNVFNPSPARPDSGLQNITTKVVPFVRNWWGTTDSAAVRAKIGGSGADSVFYIPFRLGIVDTALGSDTVAPKAPDTVAAVALSSSAIRISWAPVSLDEEPDPFTTNLSNHRIYRSTNANTADWGAPIATTAVEDSYVDAGLPPGTTYFYRVTSLDNASPYVNESFYSDSIASAATPFDTLGVAINQTTAKIVDPDPSGETGVLGLLVTASSFDTVLSVAAIFPDRTGAAFDNLDFLAVKLYRDANQNAQYESGIDTFVASLSYETSTGKWLSGALSLPIGGSDDSLNFDVTVIASETFTTGGETFLARIPAGGIAATLGGTAPLSALTATAVHRMETFADFVNSAFLLEVDTYLSPDTIFLSAEDMGANLDSGLIETVVVVVTKDSGTPDTETVTLTEAAADSGIFVGTLLLTQQSADSAPQNGKLFASAGDRIRVVFGGDFDTALIVGGASPPPLVTLSAPALSFDTIFRNLPETHVFAFSINNPSIDTLGIFRMRLAGSLPNTSVASLKIFQDANKNARFDAGLDTNLGTLAFQAPDSWITAALNLPFTAESFVIVLDLYDTVPLFDTFQPRIDPNQIDFSAAGANAAPVAPVVPAGIWRVGIRDTAAVRFEPVLAKTISPAGIDETGVMTFTITTGGPDTMTAVRFRITGPAVSTTLVETVGFYDDSNKNREFDTGGVDFFEGFLAYDTATGHWFKNGLSHPIAGGSDSAWHLITVTLRDTAVAGDTFRIEIPSGGITMARAGTIPVTALLDTPTHTVVANVDTIGFTLLATTNKVIDPTAPNHDTGVLPFRFTASSADSLGQFSADFVGQIFDTTTIDTVWLYRDANQNTEFDSGTDILVKVMAPVFVEMLGRFRAAGLNETLAGPSDSRAYIVVVRLKATAPSANTFAVHIPAGALLAGSGETAPDFLVTPTAVHQTAGDSIPPSPFTLIAPAQNLDTTGPNVAFSWLAAADSNGPVTYTIRRSSDSAFVAPIDTNAGPNTSFVIPFTGNETVYWRVIASDANGNTTASTSDSFLRVDVTPPTSTTIEWPAPNHETTATMVGYQWTGSTDGFTGLSHYRLQISDSTSFGTLLVDTNVGTNTTAIVATPGDTKYWRVVPFDLAGNSNPSASFKILVDTVPPTAATLVDPNGGETKTSPVFFDWTNSVDAGTGFANYRIQIANNPSFTSPFLDSQPVVADDTFSLSNDTWYWRVYAIDDLGNSVVSSPSIESFVVLAPDTTGPAPFLLLSPANNLDTNAASLTFSWSSASDSSPPVAYTFRKATDAAFLTAIDTNVGGATSTVLSFGGDDTVYWKVIASDAVGNTTVAGDSLVRVDRTPPTTPTIISPANNHETTTTSVRFEWMGSTDAYSGISHYRLQLSGASSFASMTVDTNVGSKTSAVVSIPGDTQYLRVVAVDVAGNTQSAGSFVILVDTVPPTVPVLVDPTAGETKVSPVPLDWNAATDAGVGVMDYRVQVDTSATFPAPLVNALQAAPDTTVALVPDTYFWRVIVRDDLGNTSVSIVESFVVFIPSETIPPTAFGLSAPVSGSATNLTSVTFVWTASSDSSPPITYRLLVDTDLVSPFTVDSSTTGTSLVATVPAGATYLWRVIAQDANANTTLASNANFTITVDQTAPSNAVPVSPASGANTTVTSIRYFWTASSDALSGIQGYTLQIDTASSFAAPLYNQTNFGTATDTTPNFLHNLSATYFWRVFALDNAGNLSVGAPIDSFVRPPPTDTKPPVGVANLTATANLATTITLSWGQSPDTDMAGGGQYNVYGDSGTGVINNTTPIAVVSHDGSPTYTFTTGLLTVGTLYGFNVRAQDRNGNENSDNTKVSEYAISAPPPLPQAAIFHPSAGMRVQRSSSIFVGANIVPDADLGRVTNVLFQFRTDTANANAPWTNMAIDTTLPVDNPATDTTTGVFYLYWRVGLLDTGNYQIRAVATTGGASDSLPGITAFSLVTDTPSRIDTVTSNGDIQILQEVYGGRADTVVGSNETSFVQVAFQDGAVTTETTQLTIVLRQCNDTTQGRPNGQPGASARVDLTLTSGQTSFGTKFVILTMSYPDTNQDGLVDGTTINENEIQLWAYTGTTWEEIPNVVRDPVKNTVTGQTSHFSTFLLLGPGAFATMSDVSLAPNPFRPNDGNASTGTPFTGAASGGIVFFNCPARSRIEVFTITGRKVTSFMVSAAASQNIRWDVKNLDRDDVASGYYIWMVTNLDTGERRTGKLAVIR